MKKFAAALACIGLSAACAFSVTACGSAHDSMKLNEEQWETAFTEARKWQSYDLSFNVELRKDYVKQGSTYDNGNPYRGERMNYQIDRANENGPRSYSYYSSTVYGDNGEEIDDYSRSNYDSVENGKLFGYSYREDEEGYYDWYKYEDKYGEGTAESRFLAGVETLDYYLPMLVFTKDGKTYKADELNQVLKYSKDFGIYMGTLGFELNTDDGTDAQADGGQQATPFKTDSADVSLRLYNIVYEDNDTNRGPSIPEDWSKWYGEIRIDIEFETELEGKNYLAEISLRYERRYYPIELPERLRGEFYVDGYLTDMHYNNVFGQAGPAQSN